MKPGNEVAGRRVTAGDPGRRRPTPNARGISKREKILDIAKIHFADHGFRGASTADIASEAGLTDPGLLHHYGTKGGLLMGLLESRFSHDDEYLSVERNDAGTEVLDKLSGLVSENMGNRVDVRLFAVLLAEAVSEDHPAHEYFAERFRRARATVGSTLTDAQDRGLIRAEVDVNGLASALLAVMDGLQYQWLLDPTVDMKAGFDALVSLVGIAMTTPDEQDPQ
jgi:AcrR family transcriptional regulator